MRSLHRTRKQVTARQERRGKLTEGRGRSSVRHEIGEDLDDSIWEGRAPSAPRPTPRQVADEVAEMVTSDPPSEFDAAADERNIEKMLGHEETTPGVKMLEERPTRYRRGMTRNASREVGL